MRLRGRSRRRVPPAATPVASRTCGARKIHALLVFGDRGDVAAAVFDLDGHDFGVQGPGLGSRVAPGVRVERVLVLGLTADAVVGGGVFGANTLPSGNQNQATCDG